MIRHVNIVIERLSIMLIRLYDFGSLAMNKVMKVVFWLASTPLSHRFLTCLIPLYLTVSTSSSAQTFRAPALQGTTLSGVSADSTFTTGKLTILSFFYIGCMPCMKEIPVLNRLREHFKNRPVQVVAVAPHTARQLREWNTVENTARYRTEPISYEILPECGDTLDKTGFSPVCYALSRRFGVSAYPTSVFIGPAGELLMNVEGFPMRENQDETLQELIRTVEGLLEKR